MTAERTVLIVDDEPNAVRVLSVILREEGYHVLESMNVDNALSIMQSDNVDAVITDLKMPVKDGYQLFHYVTQHHPHTPVMFLTAYGSVESAVSAMTNGAYYYFIKPPDYAKLKSVLYQAIERNSAHKELENLKREAGREANLYRLVGTTPPMQQILNTIETVKDSDSSVLIQGDTGTGKEVIASNLHYRSKRYNKPFVTVNCAAIPRELIESELFGHEKGAFTGAAASRTGKFEEAMDGTIFLDEIGEIELSLQAKLLRVLQEREVERLGTNKKLKVNFRLICSTNRDLRQEVAAGRFREDLFYRINVVQIDVPPLRERKADIPLLATNFLNAYALRENKPLSFGDGVMERLMNYSWPGNIRQLKNIIERAVVLARKDRITVNELTEELIGHHGNAAAEGAAVRSLRSLEQQAITEALQTCNGNISQAAKQLGISRKTVYKKLREQ